MNEREKFNLMCWVLTGECFFSKEEWDWLLKEFGIYNLNDFLGGINHARKAN